MFSRALRILDRPRIRSVNEKLLVLLAVQTLHRRMQFNLDGFCGLLMDRRLMDARREEARGLNSLN